MEIVDKRQIVNKENYDVIVVGGGVAGVSAAVAAARNGVSVLLLEKSIMLGGLATGGLISYYEPLSAGTTKQVTFGIAEELLKLSIKDGYDTLSEEWKSGCDSVERKSRYETFFSPTAFAMNLDEFVVENGVKVKFDSHAVFPVMEENACKGVVVESKGGKEFFAAKVIIDATGDAEIADKAGIPTEIGTNYMLCMAHYTNSELVKAYIESGKVSKLRKWLYAHDETYKGKKIYTGTTADDITEFVLNCRKQILKKIRLTDNNAREVMALPTMPQFRTIRRIVGKTIFCGEPNEKCPDCIGNCGDWRRNVPDVFSIPYSCLYNENFTNILAAGRIVSTDEKDGWELVREIPSCALTGQAAGTAAAICVQDSCSVDAVSIDKLQETLRKDGVVIL